MDRLGVALVAGSTTIDGKTTRSAGVLCHVGGHADPPELGHHSLGVVVLVSPQGFLVGAGNIRRHRFSRILLPCARRLVHSAVHDQGMMVVHEYVPPVAGQFRVGLGFPAQQEAMQLMSERLSIECWYRMCDTQLHERARTATAGLWRWCVCQPANCSTQSVAAGWFSDDPCWYAGGYARHHGAACAGDASANAQDVLICELDLRPAP